MNHDKLETEAGKNKSSNLLEEFEELERQLSSFFSSKVQFRMNDKGKGKIVIPFSSGEELEEIIGVFDKIKD